MIDTEFPEDFEFDTSTQEGSSFSLLPVGWYEAQVVEAKIGQPQSGNGWSLYIVWKILTGEFENRGVFQTITFVHTSDVAVKIGRETLKDLCVAVGFEGVLKKVEPILFKPCKIRIGIQKDKLGVYEDKNKVARIKPIDSKLDHPTGNGGADTDPLGPGPTSATPKQSAPAAIARPATAPAGSAPWRKP